MPIKQLVDLPNTVPVHSVDRMTAFHFWLHCRFRDKPLHIRGAASAWKATKMWTPSSLSALLSDTDVIVATCKAGVFDYNANATTGLVHEREKVPFSEAVDAILAASTHGEHFAYIQQHSIADKFPALQEQVERPDCLDPSKFINEVNLWLGSAGCFSPLHFDELDNFLVQVSGRKHLTLFDKRDSPRLYPNVGQELAHCSMIDLRYPDHARFPLMVGLQAYAITLEPGDMIYIPRGWWHAVHSLDTAISINYWWSGIFDILRQGLQSVWSAEGRKEIALFLRQLTMREGK
ncbi:cupin-like domain-containing protein [Janthinobacterium sp. LM6]|uniref:cupin-like domain-containing protein n=1 Tax=Janthinobacterium sp. LM6 TaxID=1938606 RepID=UPI000986CAAA|nr:cupin-like domain-containing protein [Janthinobacterium sp. LM6]